MKIRKILTLAVTFAVLLCLVSFGDAVQAAQTKNVIDDMDARVLWESAEQTITSGNLPSSWTGWSYTQNSDSQVNVRSNTEYKTGGKMAIQFMVKTKNKTISASLVSPGYGDGTEKIIIEWNAHKKISSGKYAWFDFSFKDIDGNGIALLRMDSRQTGVTENYKMGFPDEGVNCAIVAYNNSDGETHTAEYYVNGQMVTKESELEGEINGFKSIVASNGTSDSSYQIIGFGDLTIGGVASEATVDVTATYTVGGKTVNTVKKSYNREKEDGAVFDAYYYGADGENSLYFASEVVLTESTDIEMTELSNQGEKNIGDLFLNNNVAYKVVSGNLIPNGSFEYGLKGWLDGTGSEPTEFTINGDGTVTSTYNGGQATRGNLYRSWAIEEGKTYLFTYYDDLKGQTAYHEMSLSDELGNNQAFNAVETSTEDTQETVFTNSEGYKYAKIHFRYLGGGTVGKFGLYEIENADGEAYCVRFADEKGSVVKEYKALEEFDVEAKEIFVINDDGSGVLYDIPKTNVNEKGTKIITVYSPTGKYPAIEDACVSANKIWGMRNVNNDGVFVSSKTGDPDNGIAFDANGEMVVEVVPEEFGKARAGLFYFPVTEINVDERAMLKLYAYDWEDETFANGNGTIRMSAVMVDDDSWTTLSNGNTYTSSEAPLLEAWTTPIFSKAVSDVGYVEFDVTEAMKAAYNAGKENITVKINIPYGAVRIADREASIENGAHDGKVSYIAVESTEAFFVKADGAEFTKNGSFAGSEVTVALEDDVRFAAAGDAVAVNTDEGVYGIGERLSLNGEKNFGKVYPLKLGVEMINGAQIRYGDGVNEEGKVLSGNGLRFIAQVERSDTLASIDSAEIGVMIAAEGSDVGPLKIKADKWQNDNVFTVALTNLNESNYNRNFTATPYVVADGKEFVGKPVTRSVYRVAVGLLKKGVTVEDNGENPGGDYTTLNKTLENVLQAYVNQVGVRINLIRDGAATVRSEGTGSYSGDAFFEVECVKNNEGIYRISIVPDESFDIAVKINPDWWTEYVRINNNNSVVRNCIDDVIIDENGKLTFTFTAPAEE